LETVEKSLRLSQVGTYPTMDYATLEPL